MTTQVSYQQNYDMYKSMNFTKGKVILYKGYEKK